MTSLSQPAVPPPRTSAPSPHCSLVRALMATQQYHSSTPDDVMVALKPYLEDAAHASPCRTAGRALWALAGAQHVHLNGKDLEGAKAHFEAGAAQACLAMSGRRLVIITSARQLALELLKPQVLGSSGQQRRAPVLVFCPKGAINASSRYGALQLLQGATAAAAAREEVAARAHLHCLLEAPARQGRGSGSSAVSAGARATPPSAARPAARGGAAGAAPRGSGSGAAGAAGAAPRGSASASGAAGAAPAAAQRSAAPLAAPAARAAAAGSGSGGGGGGVLSVPSAQQGVPTGGSGAPAGSSGEPSGVPSGAPSGAPPAGGAGAAAAAAAAALPAPPAQPEDKWRPATV